MNFLQQLLDWLQTIFPKKKPSPGAPPTVTSVKRNPQGD